MTLQNLKKALKKYEDTRYFLIYFILITLCLIPYALILISKSQKGKGVSPYLKQNANRRYRKYSGGFIELKYVLVIIFLGGFIIAFGVKLDEMKSLIETSNNFIEELEKITNKEEREIKAESRNIQLMNIEGKYSSSLKNFMIVTLVFSAVIFTILEGFKIRPFLFPIIYLILFVYVVLSATLIASYK